MNNLDYLNNICPVCFAQTNGAEVCPVCGFDRTAQSEDDWNKVTPGTIIHDRYLIGKCLGQGGFGITYLGLDLRLNVRLAIKEYYPTGVAVRNGDKTVMSATKDTQADFQAGLDKFLEEARTLAMFENHPNIVSVKDFFEYNGTAYMVMSYLEGDTLLSYLKSHGNKISFEETYKFLAPIMDALDTVHASGLIHRDISPDNVFITNDGQVRLLDFGAAKSAMALMNQQNHSIVLKKGYSPTEQYQENGALGPWTDIYSMAATFYRCIMGFIPQDSIDRLIEDKLQIPSQSGVEIPPEAENAILKALSIQPANRFQSMSDFKNAINGGAVEQVTVIGTKAIPSTDEAVTVKHVGGNDNIFASVKGKEDKKSSKKMIMAIAAAFLILAVGGTAFFALKNRDTEEVVADESVEGGYDESQGPEAVKRMAKKGDKEAQYKLGTYYYQGTRGQRQDQREAVIWLQKSAEQGYAPAQNDLAYMYRDAEGGLPKNYKKAFELFYKAAEQGYPNAQFEIGDCYFDGLGVAQNKGKAAEWYKKAAEHNDANALVMLGRMYGEGWEGQPQDIKLSAEYYERAAKENNPSAQYMIGICYYSGTGVSVDKQKAIYYLRRASENGYEKAKAKLKEIQQ